MAVSAPMSSSKYKYAGAVYLELTEGPFPDRDTLDDEKTSKQDSDTLVSEGMNADDERSGMCYMSLCCKK